MTPPDEPGTPGETLLDQRLRELLSPPPEQTERIVLRALTPAGGRDGRVRAPRLRRLVPAASLLVLLTGAAVFFALRLERPRQDAVVSIVYVDGLVIVTSEDEERPLVLSGAGEPQSPDQPSDQASEIILVRHGDPE